LQATGDPYYLDVGKAVIDNLDQLAKVPCGFAAIKDVTSATHEDQYVTVRVHWLPASLSLCMLQLLQVLLAHCLGHWIRDY